MRHSGRDWQSNVHATFRPTRWQAQEIQFLLICILIDDDDHIALTALPVAALPVTAPLLAPSTSTEERRGAGRRKKREALL